MTNLIEKLLDELPKRKGGGNLTLQADGKSWLAGYQYNGKISFYDFGGTPLEALERLKERIEKNL